MAQTTTCTACGAYYAEANGERASGQIRRCSRCAHTSMGVLTLYRCAQDTALQLRQLAAGQHSDHSTGDDGAEIIDELLGWLQSDNIVRAVLNDHNRQRQILDKARQAADQLRDERDTIRLYLLAATRQLGGTLRASQAELQAAAADAHRASVTTEPDGSVILSLPANAPAA